ncbi:MAG: single-stranded DNA-binding protein [Oscillospiraceae bacterium]|nr:single-stranded DNA-binding protein [Oscillospiraceae bacterium]
MDMMQENNQVRLCGTMAGAPRYSHSAGGQDFYTMPLEVQRLSGSSDVLNIVLRREQLKETEATARARLLVQGELRSYNNRRGEGARLVLTVLARDIALTDEADDNRVLLLGTLCKEPKLRVTPLGRDICDLLLAVNRRGGRSDYLPCICWGSRARAAAAWVVGTRVRLEGRFQSRPYKKLGEDGLIQRVAYEVSASVAELAESAPAALL